MAVERALVLHGYKRPDSSTPWVRVKTQRQSACNACELKSGCGQGLLNQLASGKGVELEVENHFNAQPGDVVMLSIPDGGLLTASMMMFVLPLVFLIIGAGIASALTASEALVALGGFIAFALGFLLVRRLSVRHAGDARFQPVMSGIALSGQHQGQCSR